jgi:hypothetical protein
VKGHGVVQVQAGCEERAAARFSKILTCACACALPLSISFLPTTIQQKRGRAAVMDDQREIEKERESVVQACAIPFDGHRKREEIE